MPETTNRQPDNRSRRLFAAITAAATLMILWVLYDSEFHYADTAKGQMEAAADYIIDTDGNNSLHSVRPGDPLHVIASGKVKNHLFIFYGAEDRDNIHGLVHLIQGINGKYRLSDASLNPFPYTAGIYAEQLRVKGSNLELLALAGHGCQDMDAFRITYVSSVEGSAKETTHEQVYQIEEPDFLWLKDIKELRQELGLEDNARIRLSAGEIQLLNKDGNDITSQFKDPFVSQGWGGGKGTAEMGLLYVLMGIVGGLGLILIRYLLYDDKNHGRH